ncbi:MAG: dienelactone hydrolase family protein [Sulfobacillus benefaciens]|uniref:Dienelactone hydrolase family protein n=1 Tax=Sulfobacillus benefaciens TaxID=453960 RepID=A0A2T2XEJ7_9FIRM|nr:MAG: dienelactone hydrolase family protein [Sulfobacillus benefaciens]
MELTTKWVTHSRDGQEMQAYLVTPPKAADNTPAILVIQEIWGPDDHIQDMARRFGEAGYVALAPDLYSRGGRPEALSFSRIEAVKRFFDTLPQAAWMDQSLRVQYLNKLPVDESQRIQETLGVLFGPRDTEAMVADLKSWAQYLSEQGREVGSVGYCMGGALSFALATQFPQLRAAVCNYGVAPSTEAMAAIQCPVFGFYGGTDHRITDQVPAVAAAMERAGKTYRYKIYPEAGHAFFNDSRSSYDPNAARDAWAETLEFFSSHVS